MALAPSTIRELVTYWTTQLGVPEDAFETDGVTVGHSDEDGVGLFSRGDSLVVGAPASLVDDLQARTGELERLDSTDPDALREWGESVTDVSEVLGPAFYGYTDASNFQPVESDARVLTEADESAFECFRDAVSASDWDAGGLAFDLGTTVGLFREGRLVAVSGYGTWDDRIAHIAVVTHPEYRDSGNGRAVVSRATERALDAGLVPQYRTLDAWPWSVALAEGLGFERFATGSLVVLE
ncbi:GNAT family N-acetyltransferase [Haloarchaeobius sp. DT45]|uniref:GNAT family N-acetyltransferase n=1 Tax=Haloarchaeobius sp. DT45 TaxID=3446116 RepID=UPI003F6D0107